MKTHNTLHYLLKDYYYEKHEEIINDSWFLKVQKRVSLSAPIV